MAEPLIYQAYITVTIKSTTNPPGVNEKRIREMCEGKAELTAEGTEKITFQISQKEAE